MPENINLDYPKVLYCEIHNYEVMTMFALGAPQKKHAKPSYKATKHIECTFLIINRKILINLIRFHP